MSDQNDSYIQGMISYCKLSEENERLTAENKALRDELQSVVSAVEFQGFCETLEALK